MGSARTVVYFWLKILHITAMTVWFSGLFFLPRLFIARARRSSQSELAHLNEMGGTIYFYIMTPAGLLTIGLGLALIAYGFDGVWFPAKMVLVSALVLIHVYYGHLLLSLVHGEMPHRPWFVHVLSWLPLPLMLGIAALTAAKPQLLPGFG